MGPRESPGFGEEPTCRPPLTSAATAEERTAATHQNAKPVPSTAGVRDGPARWKESSASWIPRSGATRCGRRRQIAEAHRSRGGLRASPTTRNSTGPRNARIPRTWLGHARSARDVALPRGAWTWHSHSNSTASGAARPAGSENSSPRSASRRPSRPDQLGSGSYLDGSDR